MSIRVGRSSDLHGKHKQLLTALREQDYDAWVDTGDLQPNPGWGNPIRRHPNVQAKLQRDWWQYKNLAPRIIEALDGRPFFGVPGNHDFYNYMRMLAHRYDNVYALDSSQEAPVEVLGLRWYGISQIPYIAGHWAYETTQRELGFLVESIPSTDVLLSHAPPAGVLSWRDEWGIEGLERCDFKYLFCGHVHECGGMETTLPNGKVVANTATTFGISVLT